MSNNNNNNKNRQQAETTLTRSGQLRPKPGFWRKEKGLSHRREQVPVEPRSRWCTYGVCFRVSHLTLFTLYRTHHDLIPHRHYTPGGAGSGVTGVKTCHLNVRQKLSYKRSSWLY